MGGQPRRSDRRSFYEECSTRTVPYVIKITQVITALNAARMFVSTSIAFQHSPRTQ